jgi:hypothetical protein
MTDIKIKLVAIGNFFQHAIILLFLSGHKLNAGPKHRVCLLKIDYDALCITFGLCKIG